MAEELKMNQENAQQVDVEKRADVLQAMFKHYYDMAMDHHNSAATTTNILLVIVGAIVALIGFDQQICGFVDIGGAIGMIVMSIFGAVWAWKQHERYHYWEYIAEEYQKELTRIVPKLNVRSMYHTDSQNHAAQESGSLFARKFKVRYLWVFLYLVVAIIGGGLGIISLQKSVC